MTYPGAPCVYYGDEIGMSGGHGGYPEPSRAAFSWNTSRWDTDLLETIRQYIHLRHAHPALRTGEYIDLLADGQVYIFLRRLDEDMLIVAINAGDSTCRVNVNGKELLPDNSTWKDVLGSSLLVKVQNGWFHEFSLPPRTGAVLELAKQH
jgi:glycosidase